jgi:AmmeMemoRadiSam system protein B
MKLEPVVAGTFYPAKESELLKLIRSFEKEPAKTLSGSVEALMLPHAGYVYSGEVAAVGYRALSEKPSTIIVVGPSHYIPFKGVSVFSGDSLGTPLGDISVDAEARDLLLDFSPHLADMPPAFAKEHSVEVHLPMIRYFFPDAQVVPIVMGQGEAQAVSPLAKALTALRKRKSFLLVASSDLSHYPDHATAVRADHRFLEALLTGDEKEVERTDKMILAQRYPEYYCTHCGKEPVSVLMRFAKARGAKGIELLSYRNTGNVTGDHSRVVGYSAVAFHR